MKAFAVITQSSTGQVKVHAQVAKLETAQKQIAKIVNKFSFDLFYGNDVMKILNVQTGQSWSVIK